MANRPPFNMLRAVFYLLAGLISAQVLLSILAGLTCFWFNMTTVKQVGACLPVTDVIRQQWDKIFEAILALLIAAASSHNPPPPPAPPSDVHRP